MKKKFKYFFEQYKKILIIILIVLFTIISILIIKKILDSHRKIESKYQEFSNDVKELDGTKIYSNDQLSSEHCLGDICVYDVTFQYVNQIQVVEYVIKNNSKKTQTGDLYMHYGDEKILLSYYSLKPGKTVERSFQMFGSKFEEHEDYTLSELTEEEKKAIQVSE